MKSLLLLVTSFFPEIFLLNFSIVLLWILIYLRSRSVVVPPKTISFFTNFILFITFLLLISTIPYEFTTLNNTLSSHGIIIFFKSLILIFSILVSIVILPSEQTSGFLKFAPEINFLRSIIIFSFLLLVSSNNLIIIFFILELYSLSAYILISYRASSSIFSSEVGVQYFVTSTVFSLFFIYGVSLLYNTTGLTDISSLYLYIVSTPVLIEQNSFDALAVAFFMILLSILFKLAAAPFHFWAPDVYEGAPTASMFFLNITPKVALFVLLTKMFPFFDALNLSSMILLSAVLSVVLGSVGGLYQKRLKRLLTYSAINNIGFIMLALVGLEFYNFETAVLYLLVYLISSLGIFIILLSNRNVQTGVSLKNISSINNLFFVAKPRAVALAILLFSTAALPPFIGFLNKFMVLLTLATAVTYIVLFLCLLCAALSVFYYIRILKVMSFSSKNYWIFFKQMPTPSAIILVLCLISLILLFILSGDVLNIISSFIKWSR